MKKEIVERLLKAGSINFDEALILMGTQKEYVSYPVTYPVYQQPPLYWVLPQTITSGDPFATTTVGDIKPLGTITFTKNQGFTN